MSSMTSLIRMVNARERESELREWRELCSHSIVSLLDAGHVVEVEAVGGEQGTRLVPGADAPRLREDDRVLAVPSGSVPQSAALGTLVHDRAGGAARTCEVVQILTADRVVLQPTLPEGQHLLLPSAPIEDLYSAVDTLARRWETWFPEPGALRIGARTAAPAQPGLVAPLRRTRGGLRPTPVTNEGLFERLSDPGRLGSFCVVQGPPGAGKTHLLGRLIAAWTAAGRSVLVATFTNRAADEVLRKATAASPSTSLRRLGRDRICDEIPSISSARTLEAMPGVCLATTLFQVNRRVAAAIKNGESPDRFDIVVVDEASQVWMGPLLAPATIGDAIILVGDPKQLPPLLHEDPEQMEPEVREQGLHRSALEVLMERAHEGESWFLCETYRMNRHVCDLPSRLFYGGALAPHASVAGAEWDAPGPASVEPGVGLKATTSLASKPGIAFIEVPTGPVSGGAVSSFAEARAIADLVQACEATHGAWLSARDGHMADGPPPAPFDPRYLISCFYRAQVTTVRRALDEAGIARHLFQVDTVERNQGRTCSVAFLSLGAQTIDGSRHGAEWFHSRERWNVALTRARFKVFVLGAGPQIWPAWLPREHL